MYFVSLFFPLFFSEQGKTSIYLTAHVAHTVQLHVKDREKADDFYLNNIGTATLGVSLTLAFTQFVLPNSALPCSAQPCLSCPALPCPAQPCPVLLCLAWACLVLPCPAPPCLALPSALM